MKYRLISGIDCDIYKNDIKEAYDSCPLVFDSQNIYTPKTADDTCDWVKGFTNSEDSIVYGIFDDMEEYLYGIIIFDNIRATLENSSAEVHIVNHKSIFGRRIRDLYDDLVNACGIDNIYAMIPSIAVHTIAICKRLGFKKTGYIPKALPYINSEHKEKMYDIQIYTREIKK